MVEIFVLLSSDLAFGSGGPPFAYGTPLTTHFPIMLHPALTVGRVAVETV